MTIIISNENIKKIRVHGEQTYPEECCGFLIGYSNDENKVVMIKSTDNVSSEMRERRYNIDPLVILAVDKEVEKMGLEILGIYHSHPDHPAKPSMFDLDHAWPNVSYVVLSIVQGKSEAMTSWRLSNDRKEFIEEELKIVINNSSIS
ncbi:MAG: Mov34/MPN/PAD-1 family protein [Candidatus Thorarchaeota archaeon]